MKTQENESKMTLKDYYHGLKAERPRTKKQFVQDVAGVFGVETGSVRNWILYGVRPQNPAHIEILAKKSDIPVDQLWSNEKHRVLYL